VRQPLATLAKRIGHPFTDPDLLQQALTHRSHTGVHNERLEYLGDAVLSFVIADELIRRFPDADEGRLTRLRAALVKGETLALIGRDLQLGEYLRLGGGELKSGGFRRDSILADAVEALIGAVYLDGGIDAARQLALRLLAQRLDSSALERVTKDPKTQLQEWLQAQRLPLPCYHVLSVSGEPHAQTFTIRCEVTGLVQPIDAQASSRRKAEQAAAREALRRLTHTP